MTALEQGLHIWGNIFSTDSFTCFAYSCIACENNFKNVHQFIKHLRRYHKKEYIGKEENNLVEATAITANDLEWKPEEFVLKEEELILNTDFLDEDENKNDEVDLLQSDGEATATDDDDEDWQPDALKNEPKVEIMEVDVECANKNDHRKSTRNKKASTREKDTSGSTSSPKNKKTSKAKEKTTSGSKNKKTFTFNLANEETKEISLQFLKLLEAQPCLWNTTAKSRYGTKSKRIAARNEIKLQLQKMDYSANVKTIESTISRILKEHKNTALETMPNANELDAGVRLLHENCIFLKSRDEGKEVGAKVKRKKRIKQIKNQLEAFSDEDERDDNDEDKVKSENESLAENSDTDSDTNDGSDSDGSSKLTGKDIVTSNFRKQNCLWPYQRIRFQQKGNRIASDYIDVLQKGPAIWDINHPHYRKKEERRRIIESWIPHFQQEHNVTFNYDDLNENWQHLRRYFKANRDPKGIRRCQASKALRERLSFLEVRKTRSRIKCKHCDSFAMSESSYQNHLYRKHGIGECQYKCVECNGKEFRGASDFNLHMRQSHPKVEPEFRCKYCNRNFGQRNTMLRHEQLHTGIVMNFVCAKCGQCFRRKEALAAHDVRIHLRQRNFPCTMCPKTFYTKAILKDHINVHLDIRRHKCPTCGKGFHSSHTLMRHKRTHSEVKNYACKLCDARYHQFVGLNSHMKNHHQVVSLHEGTTELEFV